MMYNVDMRKVTSLLPLTALSALVISIIAPVSAVAAGLSTSIVPQETCPLGYGAFFIVIQNLLNDSLIFASIFIVLLITYAGFLFVTNPASPDGVTKGRTVLMSAVIGFIVVISAWLIVNEFISVFMTGNLQSVTELLNPSSSSVCLQTSSPAAKKASNNGLAKVLALSKNEALVRKEFAAAGIGVNKAPCTQAGSGSGCTDVGGMRSTTINQLIVFAKDVGVTKSCSGGNSCKIVVTGGNEPGHASGTYSHGNGYKADIRFGSPLDALFQSFKREGTRSGAVHGGPAYTDSCNISSYNSGTSNKYVRESTHWDIRITKLCANPKVITL